MVQCSQYLIFDPDASAEKLVGVHRIQRVPPTEKKGRRHSSTVVVSCIQEKDSHSLYDVHDVRLDFYRASGAGGQHRNKRDTAVRLTHIPTNITVVSADQRSQHQNKRVAFQRLSQILEQMNAETRHADLNAQRTKETERKSFVWTEWRDEVKSSNGKKTNYKRALKGRLKNLVA